MKSLKRVLPATSDGRSVEAHLYPCLGSHTPRAQLEEFPFLGKNRANAGHSAENHYSQADGADYAANVENLR